jgi:DNA-binding transcriptional LysR family regulator
METDSVMALTSYVRLGQAASVVPSSVMEMIDLGAHMRTIPIVEPDIHHTIGLVVSGRFPVQPALSALVDEAHMLAPPDLLPAV